MFKDLQAGYSVMILDKGGGVLKYKNGTVVSRGEPRFNDNAAPKLGVPQFAMEKVIDLTVESEGHTQTYVVPETHNIASNPNFTIACDASLICNEVRAAMKRSEDVLASVDTHRENIARCSDILSELNPQYADSKAQDKRFESLETSVAAIQEMLGKLVGKLNAPSSSKQQSKNVE